MSKSLFGAFGRAKRERAERKAEHGVRLMFDTYEAAREHCGESGYGSGLAERIVFEKTLAYRDELDDPAIQFAPTAHQMLAVLGMAWSDSERCLSVVDFGGACGGHYFIARRFFGAALKVRWHVVESQAMVKVAKALESDELHFYQSIDDARSAAGEIDLFYSAGTLQYLEDPYHSLGQMLNCGARLFAMTRIGLTRRDSELITIQSNLASANGPGPMPDGIEDELQHMPYTFACQDRVERLIGEHYRIVTILNDTSGLLEIDDSSVEGCGYVAERLHSPAVTHTR